MKLLMTISAVAAIAATSAFAEDAYVASSGGQSINTGYRIKSNTKLEVDFKIDTVAKETFVFGAARRTHTRLRPSMTCSARKPTARRFRSLSLTSRMA